MTRPNGTEAARYANAMANAYLQVRSESLKSSVDSALHQIDEQISASRVITTVRVCSLSCRTVALRFS